MAALGSSMQLCSSTFRGTSMVARPAQTAQPRAAVAFMPVRASQSLQGRVVSTASQKTAVVAIDVLIVHPVYKKRVKFTKKYIVHDEEETAKVGDIVAMAPTRPLSKRKRFVLESVIKSAH